MVTARGISTHLQHCSSVTEGELRSQQHCSQGQLAGKFSIVGIFEHVGGGVPGFPPALGGASQRRRWGGLFSEFLSGLAMSFLSFHFWVRSKPLIRSVQERISGAGVVCRVAGCSEHPSSGIFGVYWFSQTPRDSVSWYS